MRRDRYGVLLDAWSPGWTRQMKGATIGQRLMSAAAIAEAGLNSRRLRSSRGGYAHRAENAEERRDAEQKGQGGGTAEAFVGGSSARVTQRGWFVQKHRDHPIPDVGTYSLKCM